MPIRAELRHFYGRDWRTVTRPRILARAANCCEQCSVPNYAEVKRIRGHWLRIAVSWTRGIDKMWIGSQGNELPFKPTGTMRQVRVVLTIAHLNHVAGDDRDENLKALCQWCHLNYDLAHHHETRAARKDAARPLLTPNQPTKEATV